MDLDVRARVATSALVDAVPEGEPARMRTTSRGPLIALALVLLVALIGGAIALRRDAHTTVSAAANSVPRLIADPLPDGLSPTGAADLPLPTGGTTVDVAVFAREGDDTFHGPSVAISLLRSTEHGDPASGDAVDINGRPGSIQHTDDQTSISWFTPENFLLQAIGRSVDDTNLIATARSVDAARGVDAATPPAGLVLVAHVGDLSFQGGLATANRAGATGHVVGYQDPTGSSTLILSVLRGDDDTLRVLRYLMVQNGQETQVRGHRAWIGRVNVSNNNVQVVWEEAPGIIGTVSSDGLDQAVVLATLEHLRSPTEAEWQSLLGRSSNSSFSNTESAVRRTPSPPSNTRGTMGGIVGDGAFIAWIDASGNPGITIETSSGTVESASATSTQVQLDVPVARFAVVDNHRGIVYGRLPNAVAQIRVQLDSGDISVSSPNTLHGEPFSMFALIVEAAGGDLREGSTGTVILFDSAGNEMARLPITGSRV